MPCARPVQVSHRTVDCIRVRAPQSGPKQKSAATPKAAPIEELNDEAPFDDDVPF
jgi:hypothetical protein